MSKRLAKIMALLLALLLILTMGAGCNKKVEPTDVKDSTTATATATATTASSEEPKAYYEMYDEVQDSSDFPDWAGNQLDLKVWYSHGTGDAKRLTSDKDVVSPEIKRVTGITLNKNNSFDNSGNELTVKLGMMQAGADWPDIAVVNSLATISDLIKADKIYNLTDAIKQYAPNLAKRMPLDKFTKVRDFITNYNMDGNTYAYPFLLGDPDNSLKILDPSFVSPNSQQGPDGANTIYVRDDLLKQLFPTAKTQDEIDALYVSKGKFAKEDIYDVPIKTQADFIKFLYDLQNLIKTKGIKESGKPVEVSYAFDGKDNWSCMAMLLNNINRRPAIQNYFTYYDKETKNLEFMFQQSFFKDLVKELNKLVRDKVMDPNSLVENNATHLEKLNNGQYAVAYTYDKPDEAALKKAGKTFRYRKLWLDSPVNTSKFIAPLSPPGNQFGVIVFKDKVKEEDLPQVVRYLDYMTSEVGERMYTWGPKSAGLFEEKDGKRVFKDTELEKAMVYNDDNGSSVTYGLFNTRLGSTSQYGGTWPYHPAYMWGGSTVTPTYVYEKVRNAGGALSFFDPGNLPGNTKFEMATPLKVDPTIWNFFAKVPSSEKFWKGRDAFEKALTKTLAAKDDAQFESLWKTFSDLAVKNGATPETLKEINDYFKTQNAEYLAKIK